jgi:hypothetical protein
LSQLVAIIIDDYLREKAEKKWAGAGRERRFIPQQQALSEMARCPDPAFSGAISKSGQTRHRLLDS